MICIQETYPDHVAVCYGCGRLNQYGLQLKSYWDGRQATARFEPDPYHTAVPGYVYGGLIACLIDCHGTATASAAAAHRAGQELSGDLQFRFVTAALNVNYRRPTPIGQVLELRARAVDIGARKVSVAIELFTGGELTVEGQVIAVQMPANLANP